MDGKALAADIKADLTERVRALAEQGVTPGLGTVLVGDDPGSQAYVAGKHRDCAQVGIASIQVELPASVSQAELEAELARLNADPACTGYIVQLPLPGRARRVPGARPGRSHKDADGLHPVNLGKLVLGGAGAAAVHPAGDRRAAPAQRRRAGRAEVVCVIGRGTTVGRPLGLLLTRKSENATVILCHTGTVDLAALTRQADVIVAAAGRPGLVTGDMVSPARCASTSASPGPRQGLVGDLDPSVREVAVPGGAGAGRGRAR